VMVSRGDGLETALSRGYLEEDLTRVRPVPIADAEAAIAGRKPLLVQSGRMVLLPLLSREDQGAGVVCLQRTAPYDERAARVAFDFVQPAVVTVDNARLFSEVKRLATTDGLTGISNRRHFLLLGETLFETARRYGQPLSALMLDVDRFKQVNDQHGHAVGDEVLRAVSKRTGQCLRASDLLGRYGGEEFALLLPMTQALAAHSMLAERIRRAVAQEPIPTAAGKLSVTVGIGVASLTPCMPDMEHLLMEADTRMHEAKAAGRDRGA